MTLNEWPPVSLDAPDVELSVVVPVYGCEGCLPELHDRLVRVLDDLVDDWELIFVDDRGPISSWGVLCELVDLDPRVRAFRLARNFGQHLAITAGLSQARGRWVVVMDCDLQDPPEEIPRLFAEAEQGHDIVFARRVGRQDNPFRRLAADAYFRLLNRVAGTDIDRAYGSFSLISRKVVDAYLHFKDADRHYLFILYWLGFDHSHINYAHRERFAGRSSYGLKALISHALSGLFFQTTVLLRWIVYLGFMLAATGVAFAGYLIVARLIGSSQPGWTSLAVFILLLSGFVIMSTGITGLYVGKVFEQVRERPLFVIDQVAGTNRSVAKRRAVTKGGGT